MDIRKHSIITFKGLVGKYIVTDTSMLISDGVVGAKKISAMSAGTRYEPTKRVVK